MLDSHTPFYPTFHYANNTRHWFSATSCSTFLSVLYTSLRTTCCACIFNYIVYVPVEKLCSTRYSYSRSI